MRPAVRRGEPQDTENAAVPIPRATLATTIELTLALCVAGALLWGLFLTRRALLTIYISVVLAIGFSALVRWIESTRIWPNAHRVPRWVAILSIYGFIIGGFIAIGSVLLPIIVGQGSERVAQVPTMLERLQHFLLQHGVVPSQMTIGSLVEQVPATSNVAGAILLTMFDLHGVMLGIVAILALSYYLLVESPSLFDEFLRLFPRAYRPRIQLAAEEITTKVSSWLIMQGLLALLIGATTGIALWLMGVPYASVLGLIAAIGELVPYVGPLIAAVPALVIASSSSWQLVLGVAVFFVLQQQLENHVLVPKLMGERVGLSAAGVIIALLLGASLLGVLGAILAIPTAAIVQVVARHALAGR